MSDLLKSTIEVAFSTAFVVGALSFLLKRWIGTRIDESVKHEYARKLEEHKAQLQLESSRQLEELKAQQQKEMSQYLQQLEANLERDTEEREIDKTLFQKLLEAVPPGGKSLKFLRSGAFGARFRWSYLDELDVFFAQWTTPEYEFIDAGLEQMKREFYRSAQEFSEFLSSNGFSFDGDIDLAAIRPDDKGPNSQIWRDAVKEAERLAGLAVDSYDELVRFGRKSLRC